MEVDIFNKKLPFPIYEVTKICPGCEREVVFHTWDDIKLGDQT